MSAVIGAIGNTLRFHKMKMASVLLFAILFALLIFPYDDLGNWMTSKIFTASGNKVFVQARGLDLSLLPFPGIAATEVSIEPGPEGIKFTPLQLDALNIRPLLSALLAFRGGASVSGTGFFGGGISVAAATSNSFFAKDIGAINISNLELNKVSLARLTDYTIRMMAPGMEAPKVSGELSTESSGLKIDPTFKEGITGDLSLTIRNLTLPTQIPLPGFGALDVPSIKIQNSEFKTVWQNSGKVRIVTGNLGDAKDPLSGRLLGEIELRPSSGGLVPGAFSLCLELNISQAVWDQIYKDYQPLIDASNSVLDRYKRSVPGGVGFGWRATGFNFAELFGGQAGPQSPWSPGDCTNMAAAP